MSAEELKEVERLPGCIAEYDAEDGVCNGYADTYECQQADCNHSQDAPEGSDESGAPDIECPECHGAMSLSKHCAWRDMCAAFKQYLEDHGETRDEYLDIHEDEEGGYCMAGATSNAEFVEFCASLVDDYGVEDGDVTKEPEPEEEQELEPEEAEEDTEEAEEDTEEAEEGIEAEEGVEEGEETTEEAEEGEQAEAAPEPAKNKKKSKPPSKSQKVRERHEKLWEMFQHFMDGLYENLGEDRRVQGKQLTAPGQLYISDHRDSGYISVYCRTAKNRDEPLVMVLPKPRNLTMDIEMPFEPDALAKVVNKATAKKFGEIAPISDGRFKSKLKGFDKEKLAMLAEFIGQAVKKNLIELPAV